MRYIKLFENFEENKIKSDLQDIFVELVDNGFVIEVSYRDDLVYVHIGKPKDKNISEVKDYILMFIDYMNDFWDKSYVSATYEYELNVVKKKKYSFVSELDRTNIITSSSKLDFEQFKNENWISSEIVGLDCFITKRNFKE